MPKYIFSIQILWLLNDHWLWDTDLVVRPDVWVMIDRMDDNVHCEVGGNFDALDVEGFCEMTSYRGHWGVHSHHFS